MSQLPYWIWLTTLHGVSTQSQVQLIRHFGSPEGVFLADDAALRQVEGLRRQELEALKFRDLRRAEMVLSDCRKLQIRIITIQDAAYPQRLRYIDAPPLVLYYKGQLLPFDRLPVIAVVGARKASLYGQTEARALEGAISTGAPVAAVLGNGLDIVYPNENRQLYGKILEQGCLISEYVPGTRPLGGNFPKRNRIMSGLSLGVLVVEAPKRSGSLITAELALEQGRDVYAVPGNIGVACCEGSNLLIQDGAPLVTCGWDVLQNYQARFPDILRRTEDQREKPALRQTKPAVQTDSGKTAAPEPESGKIRSNPEKRIDNGQKRNYIDLQRTEETMSQQEQLLMNLLEQEKKHIDELIAESGLTAAQVSASMTLLELKGCVTRLASNWFTSNI